MFLRIMIQVLDSIRPRQHSQHWSIHLRRQMHSSARSSFLCCAIAGGILIKRAVDIVLSVVLLLSCLPILALAAIAIWLTSPGPILFRQRRMGRGFRSFEILKLRTMAHAEAGLAYTLGPDPRITPLGYLLRRTKIDELPQLWNVLRGEMSLVGPRPVLPELTAEFQEYYAFLLRARPGLTDPASLKYSQETTLLARAIDPMRFFKTVVTPDKIRISFEYMGRANLWTDTVTLVMTATICCFPKVSRVYGELPDPSVTLISAEPRVPEERRKQSRVAPIVELAAPVVPVDGAIFSHHLAMLEAQAEDQPQSNVLPWIPLPSERFPGRSTVRRAKESASPL
jgi:lipopolysaccharide/colanic/teichoic acid biosynthesis glycosyltransferase